MKSTHNKIVKGIKDLARQTGVKKAVIGLSGGLDSAVVTVLAARALGAENVFTVALPTKFNAAASMTSARRLAKNLKINFEVINIQKMFSAALSAVKPEKPLTKQNLQPRLRAMVLMARSADRGALVLGCSNKSEIYAGYSTLYGDSVGALAPIGDLYKTEVYALAAYINKDKEIIPSYIITRPPSAELAPGQTDQDDLPPYDILDAVLHLSVDKKMTPSAAAKGAGVSVKTVREILARKKRNAFKTLQSAPVLSLKD